MASIWREWSRNVTVQARFQRLRDSQDDLGQWVERSSLPGPIPALSGVRMRLQHKVLLLFAALAIVPLMVMGAFDYARSLRHLEAVLVSQTEAIALRAAAQLRDRLDLQLSDIGLLADNAETQRLLRGLAAGTVPA